MTLPELQGELRRRGARLYVDLRGASWDVTVTHTGSRKVATATADELEDAVELALLKFDATWGA